jgi:heme-degrading monooxygenase HmoA
MSEVFASGNWCVNAGREEEFVGRWSEFLDWTRGSAPGLRSARLIRDAEDPRHFVSFANWDSAEAMSTWRSLPGFMEKMKACRDLCEDFHGSSYTVAAAV